MCHSRHERRGWPLAGFSQLLEPSAAETAAFLLRRATPNAFGLIRLNRV